MNIKSKRQVIKPIILNYSIAILTFAILILIFSQAKGNFFEKDAISSAEKRVSINMDTSKESRVRLTKTEPIDIFKFPKASKQVSINTDKNKKVDKKQKVKLYKKLPIKEDSKVSTVNTLASSPDGRSLNIKDKISDKKGLSMSGDSHSTNKVVDKTKLESKSPAIDNDDLEYVVKSGDYLNGIAIKHNIALYKLISYNNIKDPNFIYPSQIIKIPSKKQLPKGYNNIKEGTITKSYTKPYNRKVVKHNITKYTIQKGDTLFYIAKRFKLSIYDLYRYNNIKNPDLIIIGDYLNIIKY